MSGPSSHHNDLTVPMTEISTALDEIYGIRRQAALEAAMIAQLLDYKSLPASARDQLNGLRERLIAIARGYVLQIRTHSSLEGQQALENAGARPTLTRASWIEERSVG